MSFTTAEPWEEATRTTAPAASAAVNVQGKNAALVVATWRVTATAAGSADQTLDLKAQGSDTGTDGSWEDIPGGAFPQVSSYLTMPWRDRLTIRPARKYMRWVPAQAGTTLSATWGFNVAYHTSG